MKSFYIEERGSASVFSDQRKDARRIVMDPPGDLVIVESSDFVVFFNRKAAVFNHQCEESY